jgi:hypothetical protein
MKPATAKLSGGILVDFPKRQLSPLRRACLSLGLPIDAQPRTNLARRLRAAGLGNTAIEYLKFSKDEQARQLVELYLSLKSATERKAVTIDYLILAGGMDVHRVWGLIQEALSWTSEVESTLMICMKSNEVTQKAIERALTPGGHKDRELVLRTIGTIPPPRQPRDTRGFYRRGKR